MHVLVVFLIFSVTTILCAQFAEEIYLNEDKIFYEHDDDSSTKHSFRYKPPELDLQFLHMNINGLSVGTRIFPEFMNMADILGGILLHTAVKENNLNMIESIVDIGADLNVKDSEGITPIYRALKMNSDESAKLLIDTGANINFISDSGDSLLHTCVAKGDVDALKRLIRLGANVDVQNIDGVTPLYKAAEISNHPALEALFAGNARVDWASEDGRSLLHIAVNKGRLDVVKELIIVGAKVDTVDKEGSTPLYTALVLNNPGIIKVLLDNGANSSFVSPNGDSLLHKAVLDGRMDVIDKLIFIGAELYSLDAQLLTPLYLAIKINQISAVRSLISNNVDINKPIMINNQFPLHFAVSNGTIESINVLIEHGANTFVVNEDGLTPLILSIFLDKTEMIEILHNASPVVNYRVERNGNTPLHLAVIKNDLLSAEKLLKRGAQVDALNGEGLTPLCKAAQINSRNLVKLFEKNGANINFKTAYGDSPLHLAVSSKSISAVVALAELGADINSVDSKNLTPLCKAIGMNLTYMINTLLAKDASPDILCSGESPVDVAIKNSTLPVVKRLISLGIQAFDYSAIIERAVESNNPMIFKYFLNKIDRTSQDGYGMLLLLAASSGSSDIITELLKLGTDVNMVTATGFTPLWFATKDNKPSAMKVLIDNGADLQTTVSYNRDGLELRGWSLLHEAAFNGDEKVLEVLLNSGLDVDVKDERSWTPLHYAAAQHNLSAIKKLVERGANVKAKTRMGELPINLLKRRRTFEPTILEWLAPGRVS